MALGKGAVSSTVAASVIGLAIGAAGGYFARYFQEPTVAPPPTPGAASGGGGGGGAPRRPAETNGGRLAKLVFNIAVLQAVQNKALSPEQAAQIRPMLEKYKTEKMDEVKAGYAAGEITTVLSPAQRDAIEFMQSTAGATMRVKDPQRPFESDTGKEGMESLLSSLNGRQAAK